MSSPESGPGGEAQRAARAAAGLARGLAQQAGRGVAQRMGWGGSELPPAAPELGLPEQTVLAVPAKGQMLYRLAGDPIEAIHFMSNQAKGRRPFTQETAIFYAGLSMYEDIAQLLKIARKPPVVAEVRLEPGRGLHVARTMRSAGHYTVWGDPEQLLACATLVDLE